MSIHVVWTANASTDIYRPYIDMQWLKGLSFRRLLNVARVLSPEKDPSTRLCLDVTQVWPPWTLNLFFHVEWLQRLVQSHKNLCVDKALRKNERICNTYEYNSLKYNISTVVHFLEAYAVTQGSSCRPWILNVLLNLKDQVNNMLGLLLSYFLHLHLWNVEFGIIKNSTLMLLIFVMLKCFKCSVHILLLSYVLTPICGAAGRCPCPGTEVALGILGTAAGMTGRGGWG